MIRFGSLERDYSPSKGDWKGFKNATRQRCSAAQFTWTATLPVYNVVISCKKT